jgi:Rieske Fe-S protein
MAMDPWDRAIDRRELLRRLGLVAVGAGLLQSTAACSGESSEPDIPTLSAPLAQLPRGSRIVLGDEEIQVEVRRIGDEVAARSLVCPHIGCFVEWKPAEDRYVCPCHEGTFDADGQLLHGPPRGSLRELPAWIEGDRVFVALVDKGSST